MAQLCIDIGNTRIKSALFEDNSLIQEFSHEDLSMALETWAGLQFEHSIVSSVKYPLEALQGAISFPFLFLDQKTPLPIQNAYHSQSTLGLDRLAGVVGAWQIAGSGPVLAIDLGTCLTVDLVDEQNTYQGGAISPGLRLRAQSMHDLTANLPFVTLNSTEEIALLGRTTVDCMKAGLWHGLAFEIQGHIAAFRAEFPEIKSFVSGGDAHFFDSLAKDHIFVVPNLVLFGLNCILNHNVE
ncbi:type III pantothenate kinase [Algoriphagus namhaensis]